MITAAYISSQGIANLSAETNLYVKIIWIICIAASWSYFVYQFITLILLYTKYEVISSVSVVYEGKLVFWQEPVVKSNQSYLS